MFENNTKQGHYNLRSGLILYPSQQEVIETLLNDLQQQISAKFLLLADVTGQVISSKGDRDNINLIALGSLVAGDLAASQEIARITGQYQEQQMVLREGENTHAFICEAGHHLALLVQVSNETPLGWARMAIRKVAQELTKVANILAPEQKHNDELTAALTLEQEDLDVFNEALDDLWME